MKLTKDRIRHMAGQIVDRLQRQGILHMSGPKESLVGELEKVITDELALEDRLNQEVRLLLKRHEAEFEQGRADYQKMFTMVKAKLVRERGIVL